MGDAATGRSVRARLSSGSYVVSGGWRPSSNRPSHGLRALELGYGCMASLAEAWSCVSCTFLGFSVPCRNFRAHRQRQG